MIDQPQQNPNISDDVKKQDAIVRDKITVNEEEVKRLVRIITSSKYTIGELNKEAHEKKEQILELDKKKGVLEVEIEGLEKSVESANLVVTDLKNTELSFKEERESSEKEIREKNSELTEREAKILENQTQTSDIKKEAETTLEDVLKKKEILTEALNKI